MGGRRRLGAREDRDREVGGGKQEEEEEEDAQFGQEMLPSQGR